MATLTMALLTMATLPKALLTMAGAARAQRAMGGSGAAPPLRVHTPLDLPGKLVSSQ